MTNTESFGSATDAQLVPGSLYGLRAFRIGRNWMTGVDVLRSPSTGNTNWTPGEMVASCNYRSYFGEAHNRENHRPGNAQCTCGFYSYHRIGPAKTYLPNPHVANVGIMGVIEAYGRVTVGNKGMRCEKARIVGLVAPRKLFGGALKFPEHEAILEQFTDVRVFRTVVGAAVAFGIGGRPKITK